MSSVRSDVRAIAKGGGMNATGEVIKGILMAIILLILARSVSKEEFGLFALAQVLSLFLIPVGDIGVNRATSRQIAYYDALGDRKRVNGVVRSSIHLWATTAMAVSIAYFLLAAPIAIFVFRDGSLIPNLQLFSVFVGASVISRDVGETFRGFKDVRPKILYEDILPRTLVVGIFLYLMATGAPLIMFTTSYVACFCAAAVMSTHYLLRHHSFSEPWIPMHASLIAFAIPLLVQELLYLSSSTISVLLLGAFTDATTVGSYTAAQKLAIRIPFIYTGMVFILTPVLSGYRARGRFDRMQEVYARFTKWVVIATLPVVIICLFFPEQILEILYTESYRSSWPLLVALVIAHTWQPFLGPSGPAMVAMGQMKMFMAFAFIAAALNVGLAVLLIPGYGSMAAAIATNVALAANALISMVYVYRTARVHPFSRDLARLMVYPPSVCLLFYLLLTSVLGRTMLAFIIGVPAVMAIVWGLSLALGIITASEKRAIFGKLRRTLRPGRRAHDRGGRKATDGRVPRPPKKNGVRRNGP